MFQHLNFDSNYVSKGATYTHTVIEMDSNPIKTALSVCNSLIAKKVYAVVVSHPLTGDLSPAAVSYTSGFYHIPVIGISSRDSAFSDKVSRPVARSTFNPRRNRIAIILKPCNPFESNNIANL